MSQWKVLETIELFKTKFFRLRSDRCELPDGRVMPKYFVFEFLDWVNVLPITPDGQVLTIEQYRHASGRVHLEIPGGSLEPGASAEDPAEAGRRELLEETGYEPGELIGCGMHYPNPALQSNRMHTYLALDCRRVAPPSLDPFEDLQLKPMLVKELEGRLVRGEFDHSIIAASVALALPILKNKRPAFFI